MPSYIKAQVFSFEDTNNLLGVSSEVTVSRNENANYQIILKNLDSSQLLVGRLVRIVLYSTQGLQNLEAVTTFIADNFQVNFIVKEWPEVIDRRNHVKIPVHLSGMLMGLNTSDNDIQLFDEPIPIMIQNISVGGMLFACDRSLTIDLKYLCKIKLSQMPIEASILVIRKEVRQNEEMFYYGCSFQDLSPNIDAKICQFIYQSQIKAHKKEQMIHSKDN